MKTKKTPLPPVQVDMDALRRVVDYLFHDEQLHFLAGKERNHIFRSVAKLAHSLNEAYVAMGVDPDSSITTSDAEYKALMTKWRKMTAA